jgi:hypothetical protein
MFYLFSDSFTLLKKRHSPNRVEKSSVFVFLFQILSVLSSVDL